MPRKENDQAVSTMCCIQYWRIVFMAEEAVAFKQGTSGTLHGAKAQDKFELVYWSKCQIRMAAAAIECSKGGCFKPKTEIAHARFPMCW